MTPKSTKHGANLAQWEGKGYLKINTNINIIKKKNANANNQNKSNIFFEMRGDFLKSRKAQRVNVYRGIMKKVIKILYNK